MTSTDPWETRTGEELRRRADDVGGAPIGLDDVLHRARRLRRNRRLALAGGALAVAAVVAPVAVLAGPDLDRPDNPGPATSPPSGKPAPTSPPTSEPTRAVDSTEPSPAPESQVAVPYLRGRTLVRPDGSQVELDYQYAGGVVYREQVLAVRTDDQGSATVDVIEPDGSVSDSFPIRSSIVSNTEHTVAAYVDAAGSLIVRGKPFTGSIAVEVPDISPVAVQGGPDCRDPEGRGGDGCTVFYDSAGGGKPRYQTSHGMSDVVAPRAIRVADVSGTRAAVLTNVSDTGSCSEVVNSSLKQLWETCDYTLLRFSPDGAYLGATVPYRDGIGDAWRTILDARTGEEVARLEPSGDGFVRDSMWEDSRHLLVVAYSDGAWGLYRLGVDGTVERVDGPVRGDDMSPPYALLGGYGV